MFQRTVQLYGESSFSQILWQSCQAFSKVLLLEDCSEGLCFSIDSLIMKILQRLFVSFIFHHRLSNYDHRLCLCFAVNYLVMKISYVYVSPQTIYVLFFATISLLFFIFNMVFLFF
ncbi:hypothetical protein CICLE_v10010850mg [Citrus x clementina]|uniref:Uncharacterized protein n=1 Tax=Citrus clementina TaxID=85681 RepID=V4UT54_CITCL|nr:hypothetical protein CICLE_v10010850mg [Citrus x clementina]